MRTPFVITYYIIKPNGNGGDDGWLEDCFCLADALETVKDTRTSQVGGVEAVEADCTHGRPRWVTVSNSAEYETGCYESRSLHIPDWVSDSSARRIARLVGARVQP